MKVDPAAPEPLYQQIAANLRAGLVAGEFASGPLPSESALMEELGVARLTVRKAVSLLRTEGLVRTVPGRGVFAVERPAA